MKLRISGLLAIAAFAVAGFSAALKASRKTPTSRTRLSNTVSVIDYGDQYGDRHDPGRHRPFGVAVTPDGSRVYVVNERQHCIGDRYGNQYRDRHDHRRQRSLQSFGVAVSPDGSKVYVANAGSNNVSVIDTATNTVIATIPVGDLSLRRGGEPGRQKVYVANYVLRHRVGDRHGDQYGDRHVPVGIPPTAWRSARTAARSMSRTTLPARVSVIDTATNTVIATIPVGDNPFGVAVSPDGSKVYVANSNSHTVSVIATATDTVTATIPVGNIPLGVAVTPDGSKLYVANLDLCPRHCVGDRHGDQYGDRHDPCRIAHLPSASSSSRRQDLPGRPGIATVTARVSRHWPGSIRASMPQPQRWGSPASSRTAKCHSGVLRAIALLRFGADYGFNILCCCASAVRLSCLSRIEKSQFLTDRNVTERVGLDGQ